MKKTVLTLSLALAMTGAKAQTAIYPHHFQLSEVTLFDSPMKTAMDLNFNTLLQYDVDRLLTPFIRQAGLSDTDDSSNKYYQWTTNHPKFVNWGDDSFNLEGHVGGHYLTALALAYAACHDSDMKAQLKERMDYMISILKDCQDAFDNNTEGLYGFIGGQPLNDMWKAVYSGDITSYKNNGGWVPLYCEHKMLAGLRDAYIYAGDETAKGMFYKMAVWAVNLISNLNDTQMQSVLDNEHGGVNESIIDAYTLFGEQRFLKAAKRYCHKTMLDGMATLNTTFLDGWHANTQVPKFVGFARIGEYADGTYITSAKNFWEDVATNRTVCIGGNSVSEHFLAASKGSSYIDNLDGPESCNTNNMMKLSEMLSDSTHDAKYADFYEYAMWNHILSTQDPTTGGYVYFTTLRPEGYRIYSQVNQGMWCCVGTGMENHSKYGHFIYTRDGNSKLYVNLFTASKLENSDFVITQTTSYPYEAQTTLTVGKAGTYTIAIRHPWWTTADYAISVNGEKQSISVEQGKASYAEINRTWAEGDVITVSLPMELRYVECPNYTDYIAFCYGPVLLGGEIADDNLQNEYGGTGRMDHSPACMASSCKLSDAPLLIGERSDVLSRITTNDLSTLTFTIDASRESSDTYSWTTLNMKPFYSIHHERYMCYWYQQTQENYENSDMAATEKAIEELNNRTLDFVATGEQQSEAGHEYSYSSGSNSGSYNGETYRDAPVNGYVQYSLFNSEGKTDPLSIMCRFTTADAGRKGTLYVDGTAIAEIEIPSAVAGSENGFYNVEYIIPASLCKNSDGTAKEKFVVKLQGTSTSMMPGLYYLRLLSGAVEKVNLTERKTA